MKAIKAVPLFIGLICFLHTNGQTRDYSPKLGPYSNKNRFTYDAKSTSNFYLHRFVPRKKTATAYNKEGKAFKLTNADVIWAADIYYGSWAGKKGKWILYYDMKRKPSDTYDYYVLLSEMKDVEAAAKMSDQIAYVPAAIEIKEEKAGTAKPTYVYFLLAGGVVILLKLLIPVKGYQRTRSKLKKANEANQENKTGGLYNGYGGVAGDYYTSLNTDYSLPSATYTPYQPPEDEMFYGDGGMRYGRPDGCGGYMGSDGKRYSGNPVTGFKSK